MTYAAAAENEQRRSNDILLWDIETGKRLITLRGHAREVAALAFSPDGKTLASGGRDTTILLWDVARARLEGLWNELGEGEQVARQMAADPGKAVAFLKERLSQAAAAEKNVRQLLADLDADRFQTRERATAELEKLGALAEPALKQTLEGKLSPEARSRAERVLEGIKKQSGAAPYSPERLRLAVRLLEVIGTEATRQALTELAAGDEGLTVTQLARPALERLKDKGPGR